MKLLVFEYLCGGGMINDALPDKLKREGQLMLQALLNGLSEVIGLEVHVLLDHRVNSIKLPNNATQSTVNSNDDYQAILNSLLEQCEVFWPVAPETDDILYQLVLLGNQMDKKVLASIPEVIRLCSSKFDTVNKLAHNQIPVPVTNKLSSFVADVEQTYVIKPDDGIGADNISVLAGSELTGLNCLNTNFIAQPRIDGEHFSLSCLFNKGQAWLLCINKQLIDCSDNMFCLAGVEVNITEVGAKQMHQLIHNIAKTLPGLWGYIGIDLIITTQGEIVVMEINPRLTTSFAGIKRATGINVAALVVSMLDDDPRPRALHNKTVTIEI